MPPLRRAHRSWGRSGALDGPNEPGDMFDGHGCRQRQFSAAGERQLHRLSDDRWRLDDHAGKCHGQRLPRRLPGLQCRRQPEVRPPPAEPVLGQWFARHHPRADCPLACCASTRSRQSSAVRLAFDPMRHLQVRRIMTSQPAGGKVWLVERTPRLVSVLVGFSRFSHPRSTPPFLKPLKEDQLCQPHAETTTTS
jgi:hypothetical protein